MNKIRLFVLNEKPASVSRMAISMLLALFLSSAGCGVSASVWLQTPSMDFHKDDESLMRLSCTSFLARHVADDIASKRRQRRWITTLITIAGTVVSTAVAIQVARDESGGGMMDMGSNSEGKAWAVATSAGLAGASTITETLVSVLERDFDDIVTNAAIIDSFVEEPVNSSSDSEDGRDAGIPLQINEARQAIVGRIGKEYPLFPDKVRRCINRVKDRADKP